MIIFSFFLPFLFLLIFVELHNFPFYYVLWPLCIFCNIFVHIFQFLRKFIQYTWVKLIVFFSQKKHFFFVRPIISRHIFIVSFNLWCKCAKLVQFLLQSFKIHSLEIFLVNYNILSSIIFFSLNKRCDINRIFI